MEIDGKRKRRTYLILTTAAGFLACVFSTKVRSRLSSRCDLVSPHNGG
jgi:hypothetical protein